MKKTFFYLAFLCICVASLTADWNLRFDSSEYIFEKMAKLFVEDTIIYFVGYGTADSISHWALAGQVTVNGRSIVDSIVIDTTGETSYKFLDCTAEHLLWWTDSAGGTIHVDGPGFSKSFGSAHHDYAGALKIIDDKITIVGTGQGWEETISPSGFIAQLDDSGEIVAVTWQDAPTETLMKEYTDLVTLGDQILCAGYRMTLAGNQAIVASFAREDLSFQWEKIIGGGTARAITILDGSVYVTGRDEDDYIFLNRLTPEGDSIWYINYYRGEGRDLISLDDDVCVIGYRSTGREHLGWVGRISPLGYLLDGYSGSFSEFNSGEILTTGEWAGDLILAIQSCNISPQWFPAITTNSSAYLAVAESESATENTLSIYPNPFNSSCRINAPEGSIVKIYNIKGELVDTPISSRWQPSVPGGIYLVRCDYSGQTTIKKVVYLK